MRGRPTSAAAAQYQALRDPQQTRINFEPARVQLTDPVTNTATAASAGTITIVSAGTATIVSADTTTAASDGDIVMDSITVQEDEI